MLTIYYWIFGSALLLNAFSFGWMNPNASTRRSAAVVSILRSWSVFRYKLYPKIATPFLLWWPPRTGEVSKALQERHPKENEFTSLITASYFFQRVSLCLLLKAILVHSACIISFGDKNFTTMSHRSYCVNIYITSSTH